ncbi:hypothetical protein [Pontibacter pamirensis]|uniref:hypothetical protein n=1 Tax=Pontibacter pamirensis TaxID=2562824 RepID=UPI001389AC83|nr:hypothetical protein [Pontibacter pamirensis]
MMKKLNLLPLFLCLALTSCKEDEGITPLPEPQIPEVKFNFRYDNAAEVAVEVELIVSQKDGQVLLDTLLATRAPHELQVKSKDEKLDITTICKQPGAEWTAIKTYIQVKPENWHIMEQPATEEQFTVEPAKIIYRNVPSSNFMDMKFQTMNTLHENSGTYYEGILGYYYQRILPEDHAYLFLADLNKYIFAKVDSSETFVDFSNAKTIAKHMFNKPSGVPSFSSVLRGYPTAGNYERGLILFTGAGGNDYDLLYPPSGMAELETEVSYSDPAGSLYTYHHVGVIPPVDFGLLSKPDFTVNKRETNDFQITFGAEKPSTYYMNWITPDTGWDIYISPEEASFKPKDFLENLKADKLEGKNLSQIILLTVRTRTAKNYTHQALMDYDNNPEAVRRKELRQYRQIEKVY